MFQPTLNELLKYLDFHNYSALHFGVGTGNGIDSIRASYTKARNKLIYSFSDNISEKNNNCINSLSAKPLNSSQELSISMIDNTLSSMHSARSCNDYFALRNEISRFLQLLNNFDLPFNKDIFVRNILSYHFGELGKTDIDKISAICSSNCQNESKLQDILSLMKKDSNPSNNDISIIEKAKSFILEHYASAISLNDVAEWVGVSPKYLSNLFLKDAEGSYIKFLTNIRLEVATNMLKTTPSLKLSEIGRAVGYQNDKYFMKVFRKYYGATPSQFKQNNSD